MNRRIRFRTYGGVRGRRSYDLLLLDASDRFLTRQLLKKRVELASPKGLLLFVPITQDVAQEVSLHLGEVGLS